MSRSMEENSEGAGCLEHILIQILGLSRAFKVMKGLEWVICGVLVISMERVGLGEGIFPGVAERNGRKTRKEGEVAK